MEKFSDIDVSLELDKFRDYWRAKAGAGARKVDWDATWRNWCRNAVEFKRTIYGNF